MDYSILEEIREICDVEGCEEKTTYISTTSTGVIFSYCEFHIKTYTKCRAHREQLELASGGRDES